MMTKTKRLPRTERRELIVRAASKLFATRGYASTSIDDVAADAGVTKPIIYRHFGSKKELHLALLALHRDELLGTLADAMRAPGTLAERVPRAVDAWFAYVEANPYAGAMLFRDTTGDPEVRRFYEGMQAAARSAVAALITAEPSFAVPEPVVDPLAELTRSALSGLAIWWSEHPELPRSAIVGVAFTGIWLGLERAGDSGSWPPAARRTATRGARA
jgi:AcrR family transcriptional regulator